MKENWREDEEVLRGKQEMGKDWREEEERNEGRWKGKGQRWKGN